MTSLSTIDHAAIAQILEHYDIGALAEVTAFTTGAVQTNLLLHTTRGKFVLRYYRQNRSVAAVQFEVNLLNYLKRHAYPCPGVIRNKHGRYLGLHQEKPYALFAFVEGVQIEEPTAAQQTQLIQKVAELHNLTRHYRPTQRHARWNYGVPFCATLAEQTAQRIATAGAQEKLAWYRQTLAQVVLPAALPKGICHADFHFSNVLFKDGNFHALLDFDDANYTYLTFDLVALLEPALFPFRWDTWQSFAPAAVSFDFSAARQIIATYQAVRPLNGLEKRHLFDVLKLATLIDCLWYFGRGEVPDFYEKRKIDCLDELGREQFCRELFGAGEKARSRSAQQ